MLIIWNEICEIKISTLWLLSPKVLRFFIWCILKSFWKWIFSSTSQRQLHVYLPKIQNIIWCLVALPRQLPSKSRFDWKKEYLTVLNSIGTFQYSSMPFCRSRHCRELQAVHNISDNDSPYLEAFFWEHPFYLDMKVLDNHWSILWKLRYRPFLN